MKAAPDGLDIAQLQPAFVVPVEELFYRALRRANHLLFFAHARYVNSSTLWD
jgi:hypothetical protein